MRARHAAPWRAEGRSQRQLRQSIREQAGYRQIAGDTPATTGVQLMRPDVLAGSYEETTSKKQAKPYSERFRLLFVQLTIA